MMDGHFESPSQEKQGQDYQDSSHSLLTDSYVNKYFSLCNRLCKSTILEQKSLQKFLGNKRDQLDHTKLDSLIDLLFVEDDIRLLAASQRHSAYEDVQVQESFPRLYINSGQKINVDFENDLWTWRDEHSGPFSWMSKSQQDLSLADLEIENISKPQAKTLRLDLENQDEMKNAIEQFTYPANCLSRDIIDDFKKAEKTITITPSTSLEFSNLNTRHVFEKSNDTSVEIQQDLLSQQDQTEKVEVCEDCGESMGQKMKNSTKEKNKKRSPSPKKMLYSNRSSSKASDGGEQQLIAKTTNQIYKENNAFSNPLVETQWSSFVNEVEVSSTNCQAPLGQIMDRGNTSIGRSPYQIERDIVCLMNPLDSPASTDMIHGAAKVSNLEEWSAESTPDHKTHLLKGAEKDKLKIQETLSKQAPMIETYENDEILTVENVGNDFKITTESEKKRESNIPTTGFDFLDNW